MEGSRGSSMELLRATVVKQRRRPTMKVKGVEWLGKEVQGAAQGHGEE